MLDISSKNEWLGSRYAEMRAAVKPIIGIPRMPITDSTGSRSLFRFAAALSCRSESSRDRKAGSLLSLIFDIFSWLNKFPIMNKTLKGPVGVGGPRDLCEPSATLLALW